METIVETSGQAQYQIQVQGAIDPSWSEWFSGLQLTVESGEDGLPLTTLRGPVADQATLRGILTRIWDLNLTVLSLARLEPAPHAPDPSPTRQGGRNDD